MGSPRRNYRTALLLVAAIGAISTSAQDQAIFRSGTRLVEVDVVVRDKNGIVKGLTKDDFGLIDCKASERNINRPFSACKGKHQALGMFREVDAAIPQAGPTPASKAAGP